MLKIREIMRQLRDPQTGCPWDLKQDMQSLTKYTIEETYELVDAIEQNDVQEIKEELGDVLMQVAFYAQIAEEQGLFTFDDIDNAVSNKMIKRHPHIFDENGQTLNDAGAVKQQWEEIKALEKKEKGLIKDSVLDDLPQAFPALMRCVKLQKRTASVGFDWQNTPQVEDKFAEEMAELEAEIKANNQELIEEEYGDALFVFLRYGMSLGVDPEKALRQSNNKFEARFRIMEKMIKTDGKSFEALSLDDMFGYWKKAKEELYARQRAAA